MEKINNKQGSGLVDESGNDILSVFCFDSIGVKARTTFDSCMVEGIQFTYWMDDEEVEERVNNMFDILFKEVIKTRGMNQEKLLSINTK